jgi:hypothetical protein
MTNNSLQEMQDNLTQEVASYVFGF